MMTRLSCIVASVCFATSALAWEAFDTETGYLVEIEDGDPFTKGDEILFRGFDSEEIRRATVVGTEWRRATVKVDIYDADRDENSTLEFIID